MNLFLLFDPKSGEIISNLVGSPGCSAEIDGKVLPSIDVGPVEGISGMGFSNPNTAFPSEEYYVDIPSGCVLRRPVMQLPTAPLIVKADATSEVDIFPIPDGATCSHDGSDYVISGNKMTFSAEHTGDYELVFTLFPWVSKTVTVRAIAP